jgi:hypothetical protein
VGAPGVPPSLEQRLGAAKEPSPVTKHHITFGDPDLFNTPRHAVQVTKSMHERWPAKHHSKEDFRRAASLCKDVALTLNPTFVAFTPWTSLEGYVGPSAIWDLDLVANVSPVQYRVRLIIAEGSRLLELEEVQDVVATSTKLRCAGRGRTRTRGSSGSSNG